MLYVPFLIKIFLQEKKTKKMQKQQNIVPLENLLYTMYL